MHTSTHDRPSSGVHWPIHRGGCRGSVTRGDLITNTGGAHTGAEWRTEAIIHITTRGLDCIIDRTICLSTRAQEAKSYGPLERNNINTTCRQGIENGLDTRACTCACHNNRVEVSKHWTIANYLVLVSYHAICNDVTY